MRAQRKNEWYKMENYKGIFQLLWAVAVCGFLIYEISADRFNFINFITIAIAFYLIIIVILPYALVGIFLCFATGFAVVFGNIDPKNVSLMKIVLYTPLAIIVSLFILFVTLKLLNLFFAFFSIIDRNTL